MLYNTKKMQFDTEEIQKVIEESENLHYQMDRVVAEGMLGIPIEAVVDLATIYLPMNEADNKKWEQFISKTYDTGKGFKLFKAKNTPPVIGMGLWQGVKPKVACQICCKTGLDFKKLNSGYNSNCEVTYIELENLNHIKFCYLSETEFKENPRCLERIQELAVEIQSVYFGTSWKLSLQSHTDLRDYLTVELFNSIEEALIQIRDNLKAGIVREPLVSYEVINDVIALNMIKIIEKGSDNVKNLYTGNSKGIVIEALIINKQADDTTRNSDITVLKSFINSYTINRELGAWKFINDKDTRKKNSESYFNSNIATLDNINNIMCTQRVVRNFIDTESMKTFKALVEKELLIQKEKEIEFINYVDSLDKSDIDEILESYDESDDSQIKIDNHLEYEGKTQICSGLKCMSSLFYNGDTEDLLWLLIPKGTDLSNSFKAKYI